MPFEEMTVIPLDFIAIIGLSFFGELVPVSSEAYRSIVMRKR